VESLREAFYWLDSRLRGNDKSFFRHWVLMMGKVLARLAFTVNGYKLKLKKL